MKKVTLAEFRNIVRRIVNEYVANTDGSPTKDGHEDPTGKAWDAGLDERHDEEWPHPRDEDPYVDPRDEMHARDMQMLRWLSEHLPDQLEDLIADNPPTMKTLLRLQDNGFIAIDDKRDQYVITDKGMAAIEAEPGEDDLDEDDKPYGKDARWSNHADPTGKEWHSGLDEATGAGGWDVGEGYASSNDTELSIDGDVMYVNINGGWGYNTYNASERVPLDVVIKLLTGAGYDVAKKA